MKISVEISEKDLKEICQVTGERKKGPAIRKLVADALQRKRRERCVRKFIIGEWGAELAGWEEAEETDRRNDRRRAERWRK